MKKILTVEMPDHSLWAIPVDFIAKNRAEYFKHEFDNNIEQSLNKDTLPSFENDESEIIDWAANNMDWADVEKHAFKLCKAARVNYEQGWQTGRMSIMDWDD